MVTAVRCDSSSDGIQRRLLEASLEHSGRQFAVVLANAQHIKNVPGRKTEQKDAEWIAQLLQYGLLRPSYVPCEIIRDLRDLTRMRTSLSQEASRISSRIQRCWKTQT